MRPAHVFFRVFAFSFLMCTVVELYCLGEAKFFFSMNKRKFTLGRIVGSFFPLALLWSRKIDRILALTFHFPPVVN